MGCVELLNTVQRRVRPKLHVFGGIHEGKNTRVAMTSHSPAGSQAASARWNGGNGGSQTLLQRNPLGGETS